MKTTIFLFHPHMDQSRINKAFVHATKTDVRDMYSIYPDGQIDVSAEQAVLSKTDRIVWQFPLYWYSSPSLLKKWEDLVLTYGWAYGPKGDALHGKELQLVVTVGGKKLITMLVSPRDIPSKNTCGPSFKLLNTPA